MSRHTLFTTCFSLSLTLMLGACAGSKKAEEQPVQMVDVGSKPETMPDTDTAPAAQSEEDAQALAETFFTDFTQALADETPDEAATFFVVNRREGFTSAGWSTWRGCTFDAQPGAIIEGSDATRVLVAPVAFTCPDGSSDTEIKRMPWVEGEGYLLDDN